MKIRDLIEALNEAAERLPAGVDADVRIHICRGDDKWAIVTRKVGLYADHDAVYVQGHPHLDEQMTVWQPVTMDADAELAQLVAQPARTLHDVPAAAVVQIEGSATAYRIPLRSTGDPLEPGDLEALRVGCLCSPERNERARERASTPGFTAFVIHKDCPVHQTIPAPPEA